MTRTDMQTMSLDGPWQVRQAPSGKWMPATVPGSNYADLLANGAIDDPFVADNENKVRWVYEADWEYRRAFTVGQEMLRCDRVYLECDGLDTLAAVYVNGGLAARSQNQFVPLAADVKRFLKPGRNELRIVFASPVLYGRPMLGKVPTRTTPATLPEAVFVRKAQCQFGWDWGPQLPTSGIWRGIRLVGRNSARLDNVHVRQSHRDGTAEVSAAVVAENWSGRAVRVRMTMRDPQGAEQSAETDLDAQGTAHLSIVVDRPQLWWPNGYGCRPLYGLEVDLIGQDGSVVDRSRKRLGLRRLELRRASDEFGESFTFVVNGVEVFAKGANWIPADSLPSRITDGHYRYLLQCAADAHMNMLRVWGGGYYEDERFYDLCDELGLLVWQDFMFACGVYPGDEDFEANVHGEVVANVRRLRHRPCIALWCGNNEMEQGWMEWGWKEKFPPEALAAYDRMFHRLIPTWLSSEDPDRAYWPSSPSSGRPLEVKPNLDESMGDGHYWGVWFAREPFTAYRKHLFRFQSEFGFQSLPPAATVSGFAKRPDWNMTSYIMEHHQRSGMGNGLIVTYLTDTFRMPSSFQDLCYLSMILQAEGIRNGVEHWRRNRHRCSGTLYWQINDCWPAVSWAGIDYFGRWKALHYAARRFFAPVLLSAKEEGAGVELHVTNDTTEPVRGVVRWSLQTLHGKRLCGKSVKFTAAALADTLAADLDFAGVIDDSNRRNVVLAYELADARGRGLGGGLATFAPTKHLQLTDPRIKARLSAQADRWSITLKSAGLARFVEVGFEGLDTVFSDNYFDLPAGVERTISCPKVGRHSLASLRRRLRVRSVWDSFQEGT